MKYFCLLLLLTSCNFSQDLVPIRDVARSAQARDTITDYIAKNYQHLDIEKDTIPGISLERAYNEILKYKKDPQEVIVAVLDTKMQYDHEDLKNNIWLNKDEIPDNGIDDDKNGYVDDIRGWNFLGNKNNEDLYYQHTSEVRFVRRYHDKFKSRTEKDIHNDSLKDFRLYKKKDSLYISNLAELKFTIRRVDSLNAIYYTGRDTLAYYFKNKLYSIANLDSLIAERPSLANYARFVKFVMSGRFTEKDLVDQSNNFSNRLKFVQNIDYDERKLIGDDPQDISDIYYGNNQVDGDVPFQHATGVAGVLAAERNNSLGMDGMSNSIKMMPIVMVATGAEYEKDIAVAIRYAVNNGAHIINMSWGDFFSPNSHWVKEAFIYAQENNVLLVKGAGNDNENVDLKTFYPNDYNENKEEFVNNLIVAGGSTSSLDKNLKASFSSYGKSTVDLFAPSHLLYTTDANKNYAKVSGTSFASPLVAGVAALVLSYYPDLSPSEVKQILIDSSVKYDILVDVPTKENPDQKLPFSELSKSGGILNAYNALLIAEKYIKEKK